MNYKTIVVPILAAVYLGVEYITKHPIDESTKTMWTDVTVAVVATAVNVWGIIKSHKK